jgi:hypothetical protein
MKKNMNLRIAAVSALLFAFSLPVSAYWKIVLDPWTTAQVSANTTAQSLIENKHNERIDTISAKKKKTLQYTAVMEGIKELYNLSMTNIRGFGEETVYYKEIFLLSADIFSGIPKVMKFITTHPVKNSILCYNELADVAIETEGLIHDFVDIVNDGKINLPNISIIRSKMPNRGGRYSLGSGDGYNFMDRYTRLTLANKIYSRLLEMKYKMDVMVMMCEYGSWNDAFYTLDPVTWATVFETRYIVDGLIHDWNAL